jgi:citrate synthase
MTRTIDQSRQARARLTAISSHLTEASFSGDVAPIMELSPVSAQDGAPTNLAGSLTVIDWRTGKRCEIKVSEEGTIKATDFKKVF